MERRKYVLDCGVVLLNHEDVINVEDGSLESS